MGDKKSEIRYCLSDAWLLASIEFAGGRKGADIRFIIAVGDYMNHDIFTEKEFEEGLCRLSKGGWIEEVGERFRVSKKFRDQGIDYSSGRGYSPRKLHRQVMEMLGVDLSCREGRPTNVHYPGFISKKFSKALKEYLGSHGKE